MNPKRINGDGMTSRSHAPAWECRVQRSSVVFVTLERLGLCSHAGAWEQGLLL